MRVDIQMMIQEYCGSCNTEIGRCKQYADIVHKEYADYICRRSDGRLMCKMYKKRKKRNTEYEQREIEL